MSSGFNANLVAAGHVTRTENGAQVLTAAGAAAGSVAAGERGGSLAVLDASLVGRRGGPSYAALTKSKSVLSRQGRKHGSTSNTSVCVPVKVTAAGGSSGSVKAAGSAAGSTTDSDGWQTVSHKKGGGKKGLGGGAKAARGRRVRKALNKSRKPKPLAVVKEGTATDTLSQLVQGLLKECEVLGPDASQSNIVDMFVMAFELGDVREGKGERDLFVKLLIELARHWPATVHKCLELVPHYACWRTLSLLAEMIAARAATAGTETTFLIDRIVTLFADQLQKDAASLAGGEGESAGGGGSAGAADSVATADTPAKTRPSISLAGKWAPLANSKFNRGHCKLGSRIREKLFPLGVEPGIVDRAAAGDADAIARLGRAKGHQDAQYRRMISSLRRRLHVVERYMSANQWQRIEPSAVPSVASLRNRKAFLNIALEGGGQRSTDPGRIACSTKFQEAIVKARSVATMSAAEAAQAGRLLKVGNNQPHEIVTAIRTTREGVEQDMLEAMWALKIATVREQGKLCSMIPLVDVSGSMSGLPMEVAVALGIMIAEVAPEPWKGRIVTFETTPRMIDISGATTLKARQDIVRSAPWGGSTNFTAALRLILDHARAQSLTQANLPTTFLILSDMHFNAADKGFNSLAAESLQAAFAAEGYCMPHLVFWNLRMGGQPVFLAETDVPGISYMSGFSEKMLTAFAETGALGDAAAAAAAEFAAANDRAAIVTKGPTAFEMLSARLNKKRYDDVRRALSLTQEKQLAGYVFVPTPDPRPDDEDVMADDA